MAKLSDEERLILKFEQEPFSTCPNGDYVKLRTEIMNKMKRVGKVDVAGIAREIVRNRIILIECDSSVKPCGEYEGQPTYNMGELIAAENLAINRVTELLRSHLEGKSE